MFWRRDGLDERADDDAQCDAPRTQPKARWL
jgi:hypothetical protein